MKRGGTMKSVAPALGHFVPKRIAIINIKLSGVSQHHFLLFLLETVVIDTHFLYHFYLS